MQSENTTLNSSLLPSLVILAGGLGTRFGGNKQITELPKLGRTIMELSIADAQKVGIKEVVIVINKTVKSFIEAHIIPRISNDIKIFVAILKVFDVLNLKRPKP